MDTGSAAAECQQPVRDARGHGAIVFDAARLRQAGADLLDPAWWGAAAEPVAAGGRGAAWFVRGPFGDAVLRRYRRGGFAARFSGDRYGWFGESRVRSVVEFRLLARLHALGLPVPAPLLAGWWRRGLAYRAAILVERIDGARPLAAWLGGDVDAAPWDAVGATIAAFHHRGVDHADLNANNVLIDRDGRPWLIDFDRGRVRATAGRWRRRNLARLQRSLAKLAGGDDRWRRGWARLQFAYDAASGAAR
jgi:3-deoxy-D-manno-octulosonic acid kinase